MKLYGIATSRLEGSGHGETTRFSRMEFNGYYGNTIIHKLYKTPKEARAHITKHKTDDPWQDYQCVVEFDV
jgi:hypothetical protein